MKTILGSLVLHARNQVEPLFVPGLEDQEVRNGQHIVGQYNGAWTEISDSEIHSIYLPQRYKHLSLLSSEISVVDHLITELEKLDAQHDDARQLFKLNQLLIRMSILSPIPFAATVNIASAEQNGRPVSGSFYLLSHDQNIYCCLVFDLVDQSVRLVWSTLDFKSLIQNLGMQRYVFYPFATVRNRPLFLHTQSLCARWWKLTKTFGDHRLAIMRASNALELRIYKDPEIKTHSR